jgi:hypothetical protein
VYFFTRKINSNGGKWFTAGFVYNIRIYIGENLGKGTQRSGLGVALLASSR